MACHIKTDNYEFIYNKTNALHNEIDLSKELYRGELYCELLKNFTKSCLSNFNESVFSHKKNYIRTITNLLAGWLFTCYQNYDFKDDPFFPSNYKNNEKILIKILQDYSSLHNINNIDDKINNIINDLYKNYSILLDKLNSFNNKTEGYKYNITKTITSCDRNGIKIDFYMFNININKTYLSQFNKLGNIINNIMIPVNQYNILISKTNNNYHNYDELIWIILFRYQLLSSNNHQLAVLPNIYKKMEEDFGLAIECFASAINSSSKYYCSLYYDIEKHFGSIGNFFNLIPISGTYSFNPPYQYDIISNGINKIIEHLNNSSNKLAFIITIPIWDNEGKEYMANHMSENNNNVINYKDFEIMNIIRNSQYLKGLKMVSKNDFTYMDHNFYLFKNKTIQNTYIIIMSNYDCNYMEKINEYDFFSN